jgi:inositol transport system substrate-binding protein
MRIKTPILWIYLVALAAIALLGLFRGRRTDDEQIRIGVTFQNLQNEFVVTIQDAMRAKAHDLGVHLIEVDGQGKAEVQIAQVENFLALDVDAIILNPFDKYGSAPVVSLAKREQKPVVVVNATVVNLDQADAYVGSNDLEAGNIAASHIAELLKGQGKVAMMRGWNGHSAEIQRTQGILETLKDHLDIEIVFDQTASWDRAKALALMENWLSTGKAIDAVIAQNDEMALGACKAIEAAGHRDILVIGIDAIPDALRAVDEGTMCATVFQDARGQGAQALETAVHLVKGKTVPKTSYIPFQLVTQQNLPTFYKP